MIEIAEDRLAKFEKLKLYSGVHDPDSKMCAMEAAAWLAGEPWGDSPACVSPVLGAFLRNWNDCLDDAGRQKLKPYIPRILGTAGDGKDELRGWLAADWLVRICTPAWLELAGITESATALRELPPLRSLALLKKARPKIDQARKESAAAGDAAGAAAWDAAWDAARAATWDAARAATWDATWDAAGAAAWDAARDAARAATWDATWDAAGAAAWDAARDAAWAAAWAAAWDAARDAAWDAARDAAWDAARDAAWDAARAAARAAAWDAARVAAWAAAWDAARVAARAAAGAAAWAAAWDAAGEKLEPTKVALQASARELLERMITAEE